MNNKSLLIGIISFIAGGLLVSTAAVTFDKDEPETNSSQISTADHNKSATDKLKNLKGDEFDKAFMIEMISHHEGAIDMARLVDSNAKHDELKKLGQDIMAAQSREIDMMQSWQTDWGYKVTPRSHNVHDM